MTKPAAVVEAADIVELLHKSGLPPQESVTIPGRDATLSPLPTGLHPRVAAALEAHVLTGLYSHQAKAIGALLNNTDVCLATPTASGKSLVFMAVAAQLVLEDPRAKVLAIYPAKALIQDQLEKWETFLTGFGIRVGFIDGSVPVAQRAGILNSVGVLAMTPDVAHAWLMSHAGERDVRAFLGKLRFLILDEAHVYDGVFGTNMAYFLRRLAVVTADYRILCSTATVGSAETFMQQLTGRQMLVLDADADGSALFEKTLFLSELNGKGTFDRMVRLLVNLVSYGKARFLAFGDSRKAVERIVAAILRHDRAAPDDEGNDDEDEPDHDADGVEGPPPVPKLEHVLPFRAGYEADDRKAIQKALTKGTLAGVVSTSALELGLDIGDLDVVVLLNTPPSTKAFRQRIGRAGRRRPAICILLDDQRVMAPLARYLQRPPEPSWLYLENRYIQYSNALCAAAELQARGKKSVAGVPYPGLPDSFVRFVENELNPTEGVPDDLYSLKQKAQGNPHYEFPIRSAAEPNFDVEGPLGKRLGTLSYAQVLREAYPGAVYYYMASPYRVYALEFKKGHIKAKRARHFTTQPLVDNLAFPNFKAGVLSSWKSPSGFVCEVELQVSERVKGFTEQRGPNKTAHEYGPASTYSQKPLTRFFQTTGVCWAFPSELSRSEAVAKSLLKSFSWTCGVQERDLGFAFFKSNLGPFDPTPVQGTAIFDAVNGSLRLTERLGAKFVEVVRAAIDDCDETTLKSQLKELLTLAEALQSFSQVKPGEVHERDGDWADLIAPQQPAIYLHAADGPLEVKVLRYRYTPNGVMYELEPLVKPKAALHSTPTKFGHKNSVHKDGPMKWMVLASHVQVISGTTRTVRVNLVTGEEEHADDAGTA